MCEVLDKDTKYLKCWRYGHYLFMSFQMLQR